MSGANGRDLEFCPRSFGASYLIKEIHDVGKLIVLEDGSRWAVNILDAMDIPFWSRADRVVIGLCTLTNVSRTYETVRVQLIASQD